MISRSLLALCAACCALPAAGLSTRPDRDDAEYLELASRYTSSIALPAPGGEAVLIAGRWVLTAAHRAKALESRRPAASLAIGGAPRAIAAFHYPAAWRPGGPGDLALIELREHVRQVAPTPVYRAGDEAGKAVVIVGHGGGRKRGAINTVDRVDAQVLGLRAKALDEASDLQGAVTPAETGAAAYIQVDGALFVAGIASAAEDSSGDGVHGNAGDWSFYSRVSALAWWIDAVMLQAARRDAEELLGDRAQ